MASPRQYLNKASRQRDLAIKGNLRNDDEGTTTTLHIRERLDRGFGFRRENLKVKRTILREDDGILSHYKFCLSVAFKDLRNSLMISYDDGFIDDEEFILLYDLYSSKDLDFPYDVYSPFDLDELDEAECMAEFRFRKRDVRALEEVIRVPDTITCEQGSVCIGIEGLCMLLRRMAYPCRYGDMIPRFAKPVPVLSMITNQMLDFIYNVHGHKVLNWNHDLISPANLQTYVDTITAKGAPLDNCFGFIDGTIRALARPEQHQRILYNGHKRVHALKFQSIALPNGLIGNLYGPVGK